VPCIDLPAAGKPVDDPARSNCAHDDDVRRELLVLVHNPRLAPRHPLDVLRQQTRRDPDHRMVRFVDVQIRDHLPMHEPGIAGGGLAADREGVNPAGL
jgi:hypothetical protein